MKKLFIILFLLIIFIFNSYSNTSSVNNFNPNDYSNDSFNLTKKSYPFGNIEIQIIQAKKIKNKKKSPHICRAWLNILKSNKIINQKFYNDIEAVGAEFGLFVPEKQPFENHFIVIKIGDYDGRLFLINKEGAVLDYRGGKFFITDDNKYLVCQYDSDKSIITIFDIQKEKFLFEITHIPTIYHLYKSNDKYFFTGTEWLHVSKGLVKASENKKSYYIIDYRFKNKTIKSENIDNLKDKKKIHFDFNPQEYQNCECD